MLRHGLSLNFSRPVLTETITDGVVDAWVMEGGSGRSGNIYNLALRLVVPPDAPTTTTLSFRKPSGETLQDGDRVLLIVRTDFILDECCRPVDGNHVGGRVPYYDPDYNADRASAANDSRNPAPDKPRNRLRNGNEIEQRACVTPPRRYGPWVSGNRSAGDTFESWFYIKDPDSYDERPATAE
jgi:hypothetical protein